MGPEGAGRALAKRLLEEAGAREGRGARGNYVSREPARRGGAAGSGSGGGGALGERSRRPAVGPEASVRGAL